MGNLGRDCADGAAVSDLMLFGVLRMPEKMAMENAMSRTQFYMRVQEACARIEADAETISSLRSSLSRKDEEIEGLRAERARLQEIVRLVIAERKNGVPNYDWFVDTVAEIFGERT